MHFSKLISHYLIIVYILIPYLLKIQCSHPILKLMNLARCKRYFSHRDHGEHREEKFNFKTSVASVYSVRYNLFIFPLYIEQLLEN